MENYNKLLNGIGDAIIDWARPSGWPVPSATSVRHSFLFNFMSPNFENEHFNILASHGH